MTTPDNKRDNLKELQKRLTEKEGFGEALQRLRRTQKMIGKRKTKVVLRPTYGEWKLFRAYGLRRE